MNTRIDDCDDVFENYKRMLPIHINFKLPEMSSDDEDEQPSVSVDVQWLDDENVFKQDEIYEHNKTTFDRDDDDCEMSEEMLLKEMIEYIKD